MRSGLHEVAMPPSGLTLSGSMATASGMHLEALGAQRLLKNINKDTVVFHVLGTAVGEGDHAM